MKIHTLRTTQQRGTTLVGFIFGLLLGLAVALVVAIYVTKMPKPFTQKGPPTRGAEQDAAETQKNKDWDPNTPLYGKKAGANTAQTSEPKSDTKTEPQGAEPKAAEPEAKPKVDAATKVDPKSADPLGDLAKAKAAAPKTEHKADTKPAVAKAPEATSDSTEPFVYYVQVGAYRTLEDAQTQRAKTAMLGLDTKVSEREQGGRAVFRVRAGPMDKTQAEGLRTKMEAAHIDAAVVRVQR